MLGHVDFPGSLTLKSDNGFTIAEPGDAFVPEEILSIRFQYRGN
jgi:hypothetical protein